MTVLWGKRRGDVQYGSRAYWRRTIPIDPGVAILVVDWAGFFDVGDMVSLSHEDNAFTVRGMEGGTTLGVARA